MAKNTMSRTPAFLKAEKMEGRGVQFQDKAFMESLRDLGVEDVLQHKERIKEIVPDREMANEFFAENGPLSNLDTPNSLFSDKVDPSVVFVRSLVSTAFNSLSFEGAMEHFDYLEEVLDRSRLDKSIPAEFLNPDKRNFIVKTALQIRKARFKRNDYFSRCSEPPSGLSDFLTSDKAFIEEQLIVMREGKYWEVEDQPIIPHSRHLFACCAAQAPITRKNMGKRINSTVLEALQCEYNSFVVCQALAFALIPKSVPNQPIFYQTSFKVDDNLIDDILMDFSVFWGLPDHFPRLVAADALVRVLSLHGSYLKEVTQACVYLSKDSSMWTLEELKLRSRLFTLFSAWSQFCLEHFYDLVPESDKLANICQIYKITTKQISTKRLRKSIVEQLSERYSKLVNNSLDAPLQTSSSSSSDTELKFNSLKEVAKMVRSVRKDFLQSIQQHSNAFARIFEEYTETICETYFSLVWSDVQIFLRSQTTLGQTFDKHVFALYSELKVLYDHFEEFIQLPNVHLQSHFRPFLDQWLEQQQKEFQDHRLPLLLKLDRPLPSSLCSSSLFDLFRLLYSSAELFELSPYSPQQTLSFAKLLSLVVCQYIDALHVSLVFNSDYKKLPENTLSAINNIITSRLKLRDLLIDLDIESIYSNTPMLGQSEELDEAVFLIEEEEGVGILRDVAIHLNCASAFHHIDKVLGEIAEKINGSMAKSWKQMIHVFLSDKTAISGRQDVENRLQQLWKDIVSFTSFFDKCLYDSNFLLFSCLATVCTVVEQLLLPTSSRSVLLPEQLSRVEWIVDLLVELITTLGLSAGIVERSRSVARVQYLISLQRDSSDNLIRIHSGGLFEDVPYHQKIMRTPYMSRQHLVNIMKHRAHLNDEIAQVFLKQQISFFERMF